MKKYRIISFILTLVLTFTLCLPLQVEASEEQAVSDDSIREYLIGLGVPNEYVNSYSSAKLNKMYEILQTGNYTYSGATTEIYEIENTDPRTKADISTSKLKLQIVTFDSRRGNYVNEVYASAAFEWLTPPIASYTDALTFNWDGSLFSLADFYAMSTGFVGNTPIVVDYVDAPAQSASGGVGWYINLSDYNFGYVANAGSAEFRFLPKRNININETLNTDMHFNYAHSKFGFSLSFGIASDGPSMGVTFDENASYDTLATTHIYQP